MNPESELIGQKIFQAKSPEEIFGSLNTKNPFKSALSTFRLLSKLTHPDHNPGGEEAFKRLSAFWKEAQLKIKDGTYGQNLVGAEKVLIRARSKEYEVLGSSFEFEFSNLYRCTYEDNGIIQKGRLKIVQHPSDSDLLENEATVLTELSINKEFGNFCKYYPQLVDSFSYQDPLDRGIRQVNVFQKDDYHYFTAEEVRQSYPDGIDPKDMAWIWRRLLVGIGFAHHNNIINGAILSGNILVQPENHGLVIGEWSHAVMDPAVSGERIVAISPKFESWYPEEVFKKATPTPALDIYLGAKTMVYILGGNPLTGEISNLVPTPLRNFFEGCLLPYPELRPQDATQLLGEFDQIIEGLWGPRRFHPFGMPNSLGESPFR